MFTKKWDWEAIFSIAGFAAFLAWFIYVIGFVSMVPEEDLTIRVTDLESHLEMCERADTVDPNGCKESAYNTWTD